MNGHLNGWLYLKPQFPLGYLWSFWKFLHYNGLPFFPISLCLWYLWKQLRSTIIDSINLGSLLLNRKNFLLRLLIWGHLVIYPPYLVRHYVNEIRSKKVFHKSLNPINSWLLGKFSNEWVPYQELISIIRLLLSSINVFLLQL